MLSTLIRVQSMLRVGSMNVTLRYFSERATASFYFNVFDERKIHCVRHYGWVLRELLNWFDDHWIIDCQIKFILSWIDFVKTSLRSHFTNSLATKQHRWWNSMTARTVKVMMKCHATLPEYFELQIVTTRHIQWKQRRCSQIFVFISVCSVNQFGYTKKIC